LDAIVVENEIPKSIGYFLDQRLGTEPELSDWKVVLYSRVSPERAAYDPNYITIHFKYIGLKYQRVHDVDFLAAKMALLRLFNADLIWFQISETNEHRDFWAIIRDIDHSKSWTRFK